MAKKKQKSSQNKDKNQELKEQPVVVEDEAEAAAAAKQEKEDEEKEEEEERSFEDLGLDPRLIRALIKKNIDKPTPIQRVAIPLILVTDLLNQFWSVSWFV